jgi:hypothetical protein
LTCKSRGGEHLREHERADENQSSFHRQKKRQRFAAKLCHSPLGRAILFDFWQKSPTIGQGFLEF